ncbi:MAG: winged helix-turn-helix transcriptional regulator, partial [Desulfuromonadaceae bacterium]
SIGGSIEEEVAQAELTDRQLAVLELIKQNPHMPYRKMAKELDINDSAVKKHLEKLKAAGAIERIGGTRGYWKVKG